MRPTMPRSVFTSALVLSVLHIFERSDTNSVGGSTWCLCSVLWTRLARRVPKGWCESIVCIAWVRLGPAWPLADTTFACQCPLSGVKRTSQLMGEMSAYDPKRTLDFSIDFTKRSHLHTAYVGLINGLLHQACCLSLFNKVAHIADAATLALGSHCYKRDIRKPVFQNARTRRFIAERQEGDARPSIGVDFAAVHHLDCSGNTL